MIKKPSRENNRKFFGVAEYILVIFALRLIPVMALIPTKIRMRALNIGYKLFGEETN